MYALVLFVVD